MCTVLAFRVILLRHSHGAVLRVQWSKLDKALDTAHRMMQRRGLAVDEVENEILQAVYEQTTDFRR